MERLRHKWMNKQRRQVRVRSVVKGTGDRPRLSVNISNLHVTAQLVDDETSSTLVYATSVGRKMEGNLTEKAAVIGEEIAKKAKKAKVTKVVFDRGSRKYHGRIKQLAEAARKNGLEF